MLLYAPLTPATGDTGPATDTGQGPTETTETTPATTTDTGEAPSTPTDPTTPTEPSDTGAGSTGTTAPPENSASALAKEKGGLGCSHGAPTPLPLAWCVLPLLWAARRRPKAL
jgi:hypothetical protein